MSVGLEHEILPYLKQGNREKVRSVISSLISTNHQLGKTWGSIARIATSIGEATLAAKAVELYVEQQPSAPQIELSRAGIYVELGRTDEAIELINKTLSAHPKLYTLHHFLGIAKSQVGKMIEAKSHLELVLKLKPALGHTWLALSTLMKFDSKDHYVRKMESLILSKKIDDKTSLAALHYAIGKAYIDIGLPQKALRQLQKGAKLMMQEDKYNVSSDKEYIHSLINSYSLDSMQTFSKSLQSNSLYEPIFIIGLPRSGTTLLSQIIASHSKIVDGGELELFSQSMMGCSGYQLEDIEQYQIELGDGKQALNEISSTYERLVSERYRQQGRIVDKTLSNNRYVGAMSLAFPKAKFIKITRDVNDTAWSCYRTFFNKKINWSWSPQNIASYFKIEDELSKHWKSVLQDKMIEITYEDLVSDSESTVKEVFNHCGLEFEPEVLHFYKNKNAVQTASVSQVRKPISKSAIGMDKQYYEFLEPFRTEYASK